MSSVQQVAPVPQINWRDPIGVLPFGGGSLIPAMVVAGPDADGDYRVSFRDKGNHGYLRGLQWFHDDGTACGATGHRVIQARHNLASLTGFEFATKVRDPFPQPHIEATKLALTATPETFPHDSYSLAQWLDRALFTPVPPEDDDTVTQEPNDLRALVQGFVDDLTEGGRNTHGCLSFSHDALTARIKTAREVLDRATGAM